MGLAVSQLISHLSGTDIDEAIERQKAELSSRSQLSNLPGSKFTKPKSPLRVLQIERAWQEFASLCTDAESSVHNFNIEYDLELEKPIRVAILDTGVCQDHESLLGRVTKVRNFVPRSCQEDANEDLTLDLNGHGTFCAGLAVGGTFSAFPESVGPEEANFRNGVAPFAKLVVGKVIDKEGRTDVDWLIKGLRWACDIDCVDNRRLVNADVVCIPIGFPRYHPELRYVLYHAIQKGKVVVCCAGGEGDESTYDIQYPARFGDVICVGSQSENGQPTTFTPAGREIDFLAPGENIWSASSRDNSAVKSDSATSYSVAIIAGICALVIAYAEKLGGRDLRKLVSHAAVMKEILRRMSSTPGHHDRLAGHGNVTPYRLLKHGPRTFFNEVFGIVHQVDTNGDAKDPQKTLGPLQPVLNNFSASSIMAVVPVVKDAFEPYLKPLIRERVVFKWYELMENLLTRPAQYQGNFDEFKPLEAADEWTEVDLTLNSREFSKMTEGRVCTGLNLTNCVELYFNSEGGRPKTVQKLILPAFKDVVHYDAKAIFKLIKPLQIMMQGAAPLTYLVDTLCGLSSQEDEKVIICEELVIDDLDETKADELFHEFEALKVDSNNIKVYIMDVKHSARTASRIEETLADMSSNKLRALLTKRDNAISEKASSSKAFLYSYDEKPDDSKPEDLPESTQQEHKAPKGQTFAIWPDVKALLSDRRRDIAREEFAHKAKPIADVLLKGYRGAMDILSRANFTTKVSSIDLRLSPPTLITPKDTDVKSLMPRTGFNIAPGVRILKRICQIEEDLRSVALSGVFRSLNIKLSAEHEINEVVLPLLDRLCDLEDTFKCPVWRKCRNLHIPGESQFAELLQILRFLPKGEYALTIHVEKLKLESSLAGERARDFDTPEGLKVLAYSVTIDPPFFRMSEETTKIFYEICLKLLSPSCLKFLKDQCEDHLKNEDTSSVAYNCRDDRESCRLLLGFLAEAIAEELVSADSAILHFCRDAFKFAIMVAGVGRERYRRAFRPVDSTPIKKLPSNTYKNQLVNAKGIFSALKTGKIRNVTVAILGSGINAFHREFDMRLGQARETGRDKSCPFGESILGLAYNALLTETTQTFLDQDCGLGTVCAGLIAGKTKGAVPFANVVSLKVMNSSCHSKPEFVSSALRWLLDQEEKNCLPPADVVFIPVNFQQMSFELHKLLNYISSAGKIVVCSTAQVDGVNLQGRGPSSVGYPAAFGDVICVGAHGNSGEPLQSGGQGRVVDLTALGELEVDESSRTPFTSPFPKAAAMFAAAQVAGVVAYTLTNAEYIGGPSLRQAISNNTVMREILRQMCTKPGQHDEKSGYGCLTPHQIFKHGDEYFKRIVSEITEEYYEISTVFRRTKSRENRRLRTDTESDGSRPLRNEGGASPSTIETKSGVAGKRNPRIRVQSDSSEAGDML